MSTNRNEDAAKLVEKWAEKIGKNKAIERLCLRGFALTTAEKLCGGRYQSTPRDTSAEVLLEEMKKDGFSLEDEKAS